MMSHDEFILDGYGSEKSETVPLAEALKVSTNPVITSARYHTEGSRQFSDDYRIVRTVLGKGMNGEVVMAVSKSDGHQYALKRFHKHQLSQEELKHLRREVQICLSIDHPGIALLHDVYDTQKAVCLVMECCKGGELFSRLEERGQYSEKDAAGAALQMLRTISYLHTHHIVHRDIKLENFLYESKADDASLKLIDFGFAKVWDPNTLMMARCGSLTYVSPDVLNGYGYTSQCDVWSLGVVVFMLLSGYPPFHGTEAQIRAKIKGAKPNFSHTHHWEYISGEAQDFVRTLLDKNPCTRPTAQGALQHPWLIANTVSEHPIVRLNHEVLSSMGRYMHSSKIQRTTLQLLAQELLPDETSELREVFLQMDRENKGTISLAELKEAISAVRELPSSPLGGLTHSSITTPELCHATSQTIAELFDVLDANGDEQVYYSDFIAAASQTRSHLRLEVVRKVFNRLDVDHSGTISASGLHATAGDNFANVSSDDLLRGSKVTFDDCGQITFDAFRCMLESYYATSVPRPLSAKCSDQFMKYSLQSTTSKQAVV